MGDSNKQRKGNKSSSFYNSLAGNRTPDINIVPKVKKLSSRLWGYRKPKVPTHVEQGNVVKKNEVVEARKSVTQEEVRVPVESRKSVTNEDVKELVEARKSASKGHVKELVEARKSVSKEDVKKELVGARKSVSHVESNLTSVVSFLQVKVLAVDMPGYMQVHAFRCARRTYDSLEKFSSKHMAFNIKKEFDRVHGPAWHCIVGSSFGSFVTYSTGCFIYFSMEKNYILIFKTKVQKALD